MINFYTTFKNNSAYLEICGDYIDDEYNVDFIDVDTDIIEYSTSIKVNCWAKIDKIENKNISIRVTLCDKVVFERNRNQFFNRVYILFGSNAIGDSVAWIPYVEEYRKKNNVEVILCTSHNYLFDNAYPDIKFTEICDPKFIDNVDKYFRIDYGPELYIVNNKLEPSSWYIENEKYDNFVKYFDYRKISLQLIAPLILGLPEKEIIPKINIPENTSSKIKGKYVVVAMQSTAQLKYWNNPFGWEHLFDFLGRNGYKIVIIDKSKKFGVYGYYNQAPKSKYVIDKTGNYPLSDRIIDIKYADMMITISSGLAWISWAIGTPVVMISGFTKPSNEFQSNITRIYNSSVCSGCWNDKNVTYDPFKWLFCPKNNDFICSKAIQPKDVIDSIKKLMK